MKSLKAILEPVEKRCILKALTKNRWNILQTAKQLEIDRVTLYSRLAKYGLEKPNGGRK